MMYLSGHSGPMLRAVAKHYNIGLLIQPATYSVAEIEHFPAYAADNGCFAKGDQFDTAKWLKWLDTLPRDKCLFAVSPDVVGDAVATWKRSAPFLPIIRRMGFPAAFVAQDGIEKTTVQWDAFDVLFIGGTTDFKLGSVVVDLIAEAKRRGKFVHVGRVNSWRRCKQFALLGADSADGTYIGFGPDLNLPTVMKWAAQLRQMEVA